jgi:hypothetical protein
MSPTIPGAGVATALGGAAARRAKTHWDRGHEGPKLIAQISRRVRQDDAVPFAIRERLADEVPPRIRVDPDVQGAVSSLLDGVEVAAAQDALAQRIAELFGDVVEWQPGFNASAFGKVAAAHAAEAVNEVKATDREASHVDALINRELLSEIKAAVSEPESASQEIGALLRGPLEQIGEEANARAAVDRQEVEEFAEAAELASGIAAALVAAKLSPAAVTFWLWSAQLLAAAGEKDRAHAVLEQIAWAHMDSPLHTATLSAIAELRRIEGDDWLIRGLEAIESWPRLPWATKWLDEAIAADERPDVGLRWRAARARIAALLEGDQEAVIRLTDGLGGRVESGSRLDLELDRLEALEAVQGRSAGDLAWEGLSDWVETEAAAADQARAWQRRGCVLAGRGDVEATRRAFRKVLRICERDRGSSTRAADAMFSLWQAESLLGVQTLDMVARGIAANMRAAGAASWADGLLHSADGLRISGDLFRAHSDYWKALAVYRDAGDLHGVHLVSNRLADLFSASGRPEAALEMALRSGSGSRAAKASAQVETAEVERQLSGVTTPWQREAAYHVFIELEARVPAHTVRAFADRLLQDSSDGPEATVSQRLPATALEALGSVALQVPEGAREAVFERLRAGVRNVKLINAGRACAMGLLRAGVLGMTDASDELIDIFLAGEGFDYITAYDAASLIAGNAARRARVGRAALDGNRQAARIVILAEPAENEVGIWRSAADRLTREYIAEQVRIESESDDETQWSINMSARFEEGGMAAVYASSETRHELLVHVLNIADDDELPESVRASAMRSVHPMLRVLEEGDVSRVAETAQRLAGGEYLHSDLESPDIDPLSNVQHAADTAGLLQAAALGALGVIEQLQPGRFSGELSCIVEQALTHEQPWVRCAALDVLGRAEEVRADVDLDVFVGDSSPSVRLEALKVAKVRQAERLKALLASAVTDPDFNVRATVLALARAVEDRDIVTRMAEGDDDAFLRGLAEIGVSELQD